MKDHNTFLFKNICLSLFLKRVETSVGVWERDRDREMDTGWQRTAILTFA